jgi:hypothetical protein
VGGYDGLVLILRELSRESDIDHNGSSNGFGVTSGGNGGGGGGGHGESRYAPVAVSESQHAAQQTAPKVLGMVRAFGRGISGISGNHKSPVSGINGSGESETFPRDHVAFDVPSAASFLNRTMDETQENGGNSNRHHHHHHHKHHHHHHHDDRPSHNNDVGHKENAGSIGRDDNGNAKAAIKIVFSHVASGGDLERSETNKDPFAFDDDGPGMEYRADATMEDAPSGATTAAGSATVGADAEPKYVRIEFAPWERGSTSVAETEALVRFYNAIM